MKLWLLDWSALVRMVIRAADEGSARYMAEQEAGFSAASWDCKELLTDGPLEIVILYDRRP